MGSIKKALEIQNKALKVEVDKTVQKTLLLLDAPKDSTYEIKKAFGWNNTEKRAEAKLGELLEASKFIEEKGDGIILKSALDLILIQNNYKLTTLKDYKGKITNDLLLIIEKYFKETGGLIGSDANKDKLLIAEPILGGKYDENAKHSKELIILEDISDFRFNNHQGYKIIGKCGNPNVFVNRIKAFFFTHTRQLNALRNTILFTSIFLALFILLKLAFLVTWKSQGTGLMGFLLWADWFLEYCLAGLMVILISKFFIIPIQGDTQSKDYSSFNFFNDEQYKLIKSAISPYDSEKIFYPLSTSYLGNENRYDKRQDYTLKGKLLETVKLYNRIGKSIMLLIPLILYYLLQVLPLALFMYINDVQITKEDRVYKPTSAITYSITETNK